MKRADWRSAWRGAADRIGATVGRATTPALLLAVGVSVAAAAPADGIYRCTGADGKTVFTSNPAACPNAKRHVLTGQVQVVVERGGPAATMRGARPSRPAARAGEAADGLEQMWRRKRSESQQQLGQLERRLSDTQWMAKTCNRGGEWYRKDEAGIRQHVSCDRVKARLQKLEEERNALQAYLRTGLEEECRRAGCLPGWIR